MLDWCIPDSSFSCNLPTLSQSFASEHPTVFTMIAQTNHTTIAQFSLYNVCSLHVWWAKIDYFMYDVMLEPLPDCSFVLFFWGLGLHDKARKFLLKDFIQALSSLGTVNTGCAKFQQESPILMDNKQFLCGVIIQTV